MAMLCAAIYWSSAQMTNWSVHTERKNSCLTRLVIFIGRPEKAGLSNDVIDICISDCCQSRDVWLYGTIIVLSYGPARNRRKVADLT